MENPTTNPANPTPPPWKSIGCCLIIPSMLGWRHNSFWISTWHSPNKRSTDCQTISRGINSEMWSYIHSYLGWLVKAITWSLCHRSIDASVNANPVLTQKKGKSSYVKQKRGNVNNKRKSISEHNISPHCYVNCVIDMQDFISIIHATRPFVKRQDFSLWKSIRFITKRESTDTSSLEICPVYTNCM